jgi:urease accessory protein
VNSLVQPTLSASPTHGVWPAHLHLQFANTERGTRLWRKTQHGPLYVQRPFYPEGSELAHVYLLHPPGGLVSGDKLAVQLQLAEQTQVLCTTPGAGRVYRARADKRVQQQHNKLVLGAGASLEWLPQETILYDGAEAKLSTTVQLATGARFIGWELTALGLPAAQALWQRGNLRQRFELWQHDKLLLREQLVLAADSMGLLHASIGWRSMSVAGLFVCGPCTADELTQVPWEALRALAPAANSALFSCTRVSSLLVLRYLGHSPQQARHLFIQAWQLLRPLLLQRAACPPAIWST